MAPKKLVHEGIPQAVSGLLETDDINILNNTKYDFDSAKRSAAAARQEYAEASTAGQSAGTSQNPIPISEGSATESINAPGSKTLQELYETAIPVRRTAKIKITPQEHKDFLDKYIDENTRPGGWTSYVQMRTRFPEFDKLYSRPAMTAYKKERDESKP